MSESTIGILGGGQLCRMMLEACNNLGVKAVVLDSENCPAKQVYRSKEHVDGLFTDEADIERLLQKCDVVTLDLEHINLPALKRLSEKYSRPCFPSIDDLERIQDKFIQKQLYLEAGVSCSHAISLSGFTESKSLSYALKAHFTQSEQKDDSKPLAIIKKRIGSYDGKGNFILTRETTDDELKIFFGNFDISEFYAEEYVPFIKELAVMVVRTQSGEVFSYPCVETIQEKNICHYVIAPAEITNDLALEAQKAAKKIVTNLSSAGVFGVELFLLEDGTIQANEIAPRPHNSGHYTIEACHYSQFEAHIRAVAGLRITPESIAFKVDGTHAVMVNILGTEPKQYDNYINEIIDNPKLSVHLYGKGESRPLRKMGHFTTIANTYNRCLDNIGPLLNQKLIQKKSNVQVGIIMGSDSDLPVMKQAADILKKFHIEFEVTIVSAHRTPERLFSYAKTAVDRNIKVIIAGAGGAAHLPGMVASLTTLPVIGVPVKGSSLDGVDSLYSIVQMPRGIPVATVAINNAENAGILAARIIGSTDIMVNQKLEQHTTDMQYQVGQKIERLERLGYEDYLNNK